MNNIRLKCYPYNFMERRSTHVNILGDFIKFDYNNQLMIFIDPVNKKESYIHCKFSTDRIFKMWSINKS